MRHAGSGVIWNRIPFETRRLTGHSRERRESGLPAADFRWVPGQIPASAGMTPPGIARASQMTPPPVMRVADQFGAGGL